MLTALMTLSIIYLIGVIFALIIIFVLNFLAFQYKLEYSYMFYSWLVPVILGVVIYERMGK